MQIDKSIYKASGDWMDTKQNIKESRNNTRKSGKQIFNNAEGTYTNVGKKLYCLVNLFDADEDFEIEPMAENVNIDTNLNTNQKGEYIVKYIKKKHNMMIGERTAEDLKVNIGCVYPKIQDTEMDIRGRDLITGLPKTITIKSSEMMEALAEPAMMIVDAVHSTLERTPPELAADISDKGIYMTGGGCLIDGLDKLLQEKTGINVMIAQDSISCVALGTGKALDNLDTLDGRSK